MKVKKYIVVILLCVLCVCTLFSACELFGGKDTTPSGDNSSISNNDNPDETIQTPPDGGNTGDGSSEIFSPLDPDFVPDINKSYIVTSVIKNSYSGIDPYIGEYDFGNAEFVNVPDGREIKDIVGASNIGGKYNFTTLPYLQEGAEMVTHDLGSSVFKLALTPDYKDIYSYNTTWSDVTTMTELAQTKQYSTVFSNSDIKTYIIVAEEFNTCTWDDVVTDNRDPNWFYHQYLTVTSEYYDLAKYLLQTYGNKDKTFIITSGNGDEIFGPLYDQCTNYTQQTALIETYTRYLNARQDGINKAVAEVTGKKAKVYGCIEVNHLSKEIQGVPSRVRLVDCVLPNTKADLYSFADSYTTLEDIDITRELNYLASKIPNPNPDFAGKKNIILGAISYPSNTAGNDQQQYITCRNAIKDAIEYGVQYAVYESYCCTTRTDLSLDDRPTNGNMAGYWLIKPDGSFSTIFWYLKGLNDNLNYLVKIPQVKLDVKL